MSVEHRTWKQQLVCKSKSENLNGEGELNEATNSKAETCTKVMHPSGLPYGGLALGAAKPRLRLKFNPGAYTTPGTLTTGIERSQKGSSGTVYTQMGLCRQKISNHGTLSNSFQRGFGHWRWK